MRARENVELTGRRHPGTFFRVAAGDFPGGTLDGTPTCAGSRLLRDASLLNAALDDFVAARGLPDGVAVRYEPHRWRELTVLLGYRDSASAYVFQGTHDDPVGERPLVGSELPEIDPDRQLAQQVQQLERWLPAQARLARVGRRVLLGFSTGPTGVGVADYGIIVLPADGATSLRFGHRADAAGRVVAWVDPAGPNHGQLDAGDLIVSSGRDCAVSGSALAASASCRVSVIRGDAAVELDIVSEVVPRRVGFAVADDLTPHAYAKQDGVVVSMGLLNALASDDELAWVISHELGHIELGHSRIEVTPGDALHGLLWIGVFVPVSIAVPGLGDALDDLTHGLRARFNREQERDADRAGVRYAYAAGFDPDAALTALATLEKLAPGEAMLDEHPPYAERRTILATEIATLSAGAGAETSRGKIAR